MKTSLKSILLKEIQTKKFTRIDDLRKLANDNGYIESNAERVLRKLREFKEVKVLYNKKGYVKGYTYKDVVEQGSIF